jgi:hypothetical protein
MGECAGVAIGAANFTFEDSRVKISGHAGDSALFDDEAGLPTTPSRPDEPGFNAGIVVVALLLTCNDEVDDEESGRNTPPPPFPPLPPSPPPPDEEFDVLFMLELLNVLLLRL